MTEKVKKFMDFYRIQEVARRREIRDRFLDRSGRRYPAFYGKLKRASFSRLELESLHEICTEVCGVSFDE